MIKKAFSVLLVLLILCTFNANADYTFDVDIGDGTKNTSADDREYVPQNDVFPENQGFSTKSMLVLTLMLCIGGATVYAIKKKSK